MPLNAFKTTYFSKIVILFGLLFLQPVKTASDILMLVDNPYDCITDGFYDCNICPCNLTKSSLILTLVLSVLTLLCSGFLVVAFLRVKPIREQPGDIIAAVAFSDVIFSITLLIDCRIDSGISGPLQNTSECIAMSYVKTLLLLIIDIYHISFCAFFLMSLNGSLKSRAVSWYTYHIWPLLISGGILFAFYELESIGRNIYGLCGTKTLPGVIIPLLRYGLVAVAIILFSLLMIRLIPKNQRIHALRNDFLKYYSKIVAALVLLYILNGLIDAWIGSITDEFLQNQLDQTPIDILNYAKVIKVILITLTPIILTVARFTDPEMKPHWKKVLPSCISRYRFKTRSSSAIDPRKVSLDLVTIQRNIAKKPHLFQFQHSIRVQVVYSLLSAIHFFWHLKQKRSESYCHEATIKTETVYSEADAKLRECFPISMELIGAAIPELLDEITAKQYNFANTTFIVYAPKIFEEIIELDDVGRSIRKSLDLRENFNRILKSGINGGGKSGEFFFFSSDNKIIIKTISTSELCTLINILPAYLNHFRANPESLIAKIYGVFTLSVSSTSEDFHLILMKNINGLPTMFVRRKYDLKGSTVHRRAIKNENVEFRDLFLYTNLKDLDFQKYEKKLHIGPEISPNLIEVIRKDVLFLASQNLVDYSLAVYIVDKDKQLRRLKTLARTLEQEKIKELEESGQTEEKEEEKEKEKPLEPNENQTSSYLNSIKSTQEEFYYHLGIIDYLIPFNFRKRAEVFFKKLTALDPNSDISVQKPDFYARRFIKNVENILSNNT